MKLVLFSTFSSLFLLLAAPLFVSPLFASPLSSEEVGGHVKTGKGLPVEHARVTDVTTAQSVHTDRDGHFLLDCSSPCLLLVAHPRFEDLVTENARGQDLDFVLQAKQEVYEEIVVTGERGGGDRLAPMSIASTVVQPDEKIGSPATLTELTQGAPAVAENGQGGLFQVLSIRGVSRHRVLTLVDGMRVIGERRAGVSTSFIDPTLMGGVDVLRGPASTWYGSGALGGVLQIFPKRHESFRIEVGYEEFGDTQHQSLGWGDGTWSLALAHRDAGNDVGADGRFYYGQFTQVSAALSRRWQSASEKYSYQVQALPSWGDEIGKPNLDIPLRITTYPRERHILLKFGMSGASGWSAHVFAHPNELDTHDVRFERSLTVVENEALDVGGAWQMPFALSTNTTARVGVDWVGRRGINALETEQSLRDDRVFISQTLDDARQDEVAGYGSLRWGKGRVSYQAGLRFTWQQQRNGTDPSEEDQAATGFLGVVIPLGGGVEMTANAGTGLRFPNLSERFFSGTTGRGQVIGNPDLDPEESVNVDLGLRWFGRKVFLGVQVFRLEIDDYIERIRITPDVRTFVNLLSGSIEGLEIEGFYQPAPRWRLDWSGHLLEGENDRGLRLTDIPADRFRVGVSFREDRWESGLDVQLRDRLDEVGPGEQPIPSAVLLALRVGYRLSEALSVQLAGKNLLGKEYFNSADDLTQIAPGRSVGVTLVWSP